MATTVSPNVGDQGFLNSYFRNWYGAGSAHHLEYGYNALVRISVSPAWKDFIEPTLKVLHFSGTTKPWNMMVDKQFPTTRRYDHLWWQVYDQVYDTLSRASNDSSTLPPQLAPQCQRDYMAYARSAPPANPLREPETLNSKPETPNPMHGHDPFQTPIPQ